MRASSERRYTDARARAEQQSSRAFSACLRIPEGVSMFKPKAGTMYIDILPYVVGKGNPYADPGSLHWERTYYAHRSIGGNQDTIVCPRMTLRQPCPICEYRAELMKNGGEENEQLIRDLAPKQRQLFNIIDLKDPDRGVQIWDVSYHLFGRLLDARIRNSDEEEGWERFFHLEDGFSLRVGFTEKTFGSFNYLEAESIDFKPRKQAYGEEILEKVVCLDDVFVHLSYDQIKDMFYQGEAVAHAVKPEKAAQEEEDEVPYTYEKKEESPKNFPKAKPAPPLDEEDEEEEQPAPKAKTPAKAPAKAVPVSWDEDDEDEEPPTKPAPKATARPAPKVTDEEDEEDEEPPKTLKPAKPAPKPVADEEEDLLEEEGDEDEDGWAETEVRLKKEPPKPAPKPKASKLKLDDDWE